MEVWAPSTVQAREPAAVPRAMADGEGQAGVERRREEAHEAVARRRGVAGLDLRAGDAVSNAPIPADRALGAQGHHRRGDAEPLRRMGGEPGMVVRQAERRGEVGRLVLG